MSKFPKNTKTNCIIYTLSDPDTNEVRYIGKTVKSLKHRLTDHLYSPKRENNYRTNWIKSIINKGGIPIIKELENCPWGISQEREQYWISQFKAWGFRLINLTDGGEGCIGRVMSDKTKQKIKESNGKKIYQYDLDGNFIKEYISASEAAKSIGKNNNSKICCCARGERGKAYNFMWSYIKYEKLNPYRKSKKIITEELKLNLIKINSKPILQYDINMNLIKEWESAKLAAKKLNLCYVCIIQYLNGKRIKHRASNKTGNYIWIRK